MSYYNAVPIYYKKIGKECGKEINVSTKTVDGQYIALISSPNKTTIEVPDITGGTALNKDVEDAIRRMK